MCGGLGGDDALQYLQKCLPGRIGLRNRKRSDDDESLHAGIQRDGKREFAGYRIADDAWAAGREETAKRPAQPRPRCSERAAFVMHENEAVPFDRFKEQRAPKERRIAFEQHADDAANFRFTGMCGGERFQQPRKRGQVRV